MAHKPKSKYLLADPRTGAVVRRSSEVARAGEQHLITLAVDPDVWKRYRAGDLVSIADLQGCELDRWLEALRREEYKSRQLRIDEERDDYYTRGPYVY